MKAISVLKGWWRTS
ncbi:TPA: trp operon leader peptide [Escherichia coli]|nr:trp operon leader peptide [Escherichia coli]EFA8781949.1 trp operon leader peptide [Escherichia coli O105]EET1435139.1 trp operon leader peptide [Escherichia coli]EGS9138473.1 trp operon leader peptide [Escherichia coli]EHP0862721.1 trp operon leader peptide [Escherichia coli]EHV3134545.1 trp operon leader peptide [Escherichia coli]